MREDLTEVIFVLDRSGSMGTCIDGTIEGFNSFLTKREGMVGEVRVSLYQFDDEYDIEFEHTLIDNTPLLTHDTFVPRGMTALHDAIGKSINRVKDRISNMRDEDSPSRVVFVIITDGGENSSKEFSQETIKSLIEGQTKDDNWVFTYLGANQDAVLTSSSIGIRVDNTANYVSSDCGTSSAFNAVSSGIACCTNLSSLDVQASSFYSGDISDGPSDTVVNSDNSTVING